MTPMMLMAVDDGLFSGNANLADIAFLIAVIAALLSAVGAFGTNALSKHAGWLLSLAHHYSPEVIRVKSMWQTAASTR